MTLLATMLDMSWTVICENPSNRFVWLYVFSRTGNVRWKDEGNGMTGNGTWQISGDKLTTRWQSSSTVETWKVPIDPSDWTGTCTMKGLAYKLRGVARNFVEAAGSTSFVRTQESKDHFIKGCNSANGKVQIALLQFGGWLSGISIAYADAFEAHSKILSEISATERLANELLLGFALAFVGGGVGGTIGGTVGVVMKSLGASDFAIDGIKDLAKFSVRGPGAALFRGAGLKGMPMSPLQWKESVNERVLLELAVVSKAIESWRRAVENDDDDFDAGFDPAKEVENALVVKLPTRVQLASLPPVDKQALQTDFEKGWLVAWIALEKCSNIPVVRDLTRDKLLAYGRRLGVNNIDELLNRHIPSFRGSFAPGSVN